MILRWSTSLLKMSWLTHTATRAYCWSSTVDSYFLQFPVRIAMQYRVISKRFKKDGVLLRAVTRLENSKTNCEVSFFNEGTIAMLICRFGKDRFLYIHDRIPNSPYLVQKLELRFMASQISSQPAIHGINRSAQFMFLIRSNANRCQSSDYRATPRSGRLFEELGVYEIKDS